MIWIPKTKHYYSEESKACGIWILGIMKKDVLKDDGGLWKREQVLSF